MIGSGTALHEQFHSLFSVLRPAHAGPLHLQKLSGYLCIQVIILSQQDIHVLQAAAFHPSSLLFLLFYLYFFFHIRIRQGKCSRKIEFASLAQLTLKLQFSPHQPHNGPADSKSQPGSLALGIIGSHLLKGSEYAFLILHRYAHTVINHLKLVDHLLIRAFGPGHTHDDTAACRCEFKGIGNQIGQNLLETDNIPHKHTVFHVLFYSELQSAARSLCGQHVLKLFHGPVHGKCLI